MNDMIESAGYYDSDDALNASPRLQPIKPNYRTEETPPPFIHEKSSTSSPSSEGGRSEALADGTTPASGEIRKKSKKRRKKTKIRPSQGDTVLISYLAPNNPDIAQEAGKRALDDRSSEDSEESEDEEEDSPAETLIAKEMRSVKTEYPEELVPTAQKDLSSTAQAALKAHEEGSVAAGKDQPLALADKGLIGPPSQNVSINSAMQRNRRHLPDAGASSEPLQLHSPLSKQPSQISTSSSQRDDNKEEETLLATSPHLAKFAIKGSDAPDGSTLPALQKSPPRSMSTHSGDNGQSLPSLQTALGNLPDHDGIDSASPAFHLSAQSPTMIQRPPHFMSQHPGPSPSSYSQPSPASSKDNSIMSPPGLPSHPTYWRPAPKIEPPYSTPSAGDATTPSTCTLTGESPTSAYPTPNVQDHRMSVEGESPQLINGPLPPNGPFTSTAFKCTHPGCTAAPFQTQYLLNSHANVHSLSRPHFCPVDGCPRSYGGKGFKRKNEMIRHGLVHDSPGYVCPFCPDQQHKYPRPDNLQRQALLLLLSKAYMANLSSLDMFEYIMLIKIGTILSYGMSLHNDQRVATGVAADATVSPVANSTIILTLLMLYFLYTHLSYYGLEWPKGHFLSRA